METVNGKGKTRPKMRTASVRADRKQKDVGKATSYNKILSANNRKINTLFVLILQYRETYELLNVSLKQRDGHAYDLMKKSTRLLNTILQRAAKYDNRSYNYAEIEAYLHGVEVRTHVRNIRAYAACLGITPAEELAQRKRGGL
jgi:hypothetical protein